MTWRARVFLGTAFIVLFAGSVMVFEAFDRQSNSNSDTLRPFLITMVPVWAVAIAGALAIVRPRSK